MTREPVSESHSTPGRIPVVGIVGGIGSGKSAVARWVATQANIHVIDADRLGHEALMAGDVKASLRLKFGDDIFDVQGEVLRGALARRVFGDAEEHRAARHMLEQIVHPEIERRIVDEIRRAADSGSQAVLLDAAVLLEAGWQRQCDAVVFIETPDDVRLERVRQRSGWTAEELHRRETSQLSLTDKRKQSDAVVSNAGQVSDAGQQLLNFLRGCGVFSCKPSPESSQQLSIASEFLPPRP
ncbi:MAG: dephospho-CoA kinase [Candidatus Saccharimonas sp.]|nr:dephospho-CoA kinase [Planctomycetaceae bacterium]